MAPLRRILAAPLHGVEVVVHAALGDQLVVGAHLDDAALVHDDDLVGLADRAQPVRDDERRAADVFDLERLHCDQKVSLAIGNDTFL